MGDMIGTPSSDINDHFEEVGQLTFDQEDGRTLGLTMYICQSCGSLIAIRQAHWNIHEDLGIADK